MVLPSPLLPITTFDPLEAWVPHNHKDRKALESGGQKVTNLPFRS